MDKRNPSELSLQGQTSMSAKAILAELRAAASEEKHAVLARFFKSGPGEDK